MLSGSFQPIRETNNLLVPSLVVWCSQSESRKHCSSVVGVSQPAAMATVQFVISVYTNTHECPMCVYIYMYKIIKYIHIYVRICVSLYGYL